ncbi:hypothetical protein B0T10DRAFT_574216 [Thelonectria olida]|uniref:Uncharacterized protein n=1 Tax=Thelonectria olida TaxID=1576542 RepID=A0A9P8W3M9_9HYPO|nr:hypothetical protein B0T10DRAFT_574216 [Thelonectria olida]
MDRNTSSLLSGRSTGEQWDAIIQSEMPLVLESSNWALIIAFLALLYQLVAVRLFRPYTMALFWLHSEEHRAWASDQFRVAMANTKTPISAMTAAPAYRVLVRSAGAEWRREKVLALLWLIGALVLTVIPFLIPVFQDRFIPTVQGVPGTSQDCRPVLNFTADWGISKFNRLLALDMLRTADQSGYNYNSTTAASVGLRGPKDRISLSMSCPHWAPVCDRTNPMRLDIDYWVKRSDLRIGSKTSSKDPEFGVLNTCYLPERHVRLLETTKDGREIYGMLYGWVNGSGFDNVTHIYTPLERFGYGYSLFSSYNSRGESEMWLPNKTLDHDGDRTILFYHLSTISNVGQSDDPLFRTNSTPTKGGYFLPMKAVIPIICNTTYSFCPEAGHCFPMNGSVGVLDYLDQHSPSSGAMTRAFLELIYLNTISTPFQSMAGNSESLLASQTLLDESMQIASQELSAHSELIRLALADRARLITAAERAASDWRKYDPIVADAGVLTKELGRQCQWTLLRDASGRVTTSARAIIIMSTVGGVLLLLTFSGPVLRALFWGQLSMFTLRWRMRTAAYLHRATVERGEDDRFWPGGVDDEWPVGKGVVDKVGLVHTSGGYHAVYRPDAELGRSPRGQIERTGVFKPTCTSTRPGRIKRLIQRFGLVGRRDKDAAFLIGYSVNGEQSEREVLSPQTPGLPPKRERLGR